MNHLQFVIAFTHDIERMKEFYRDTMGFETSADTPSFVSFATGGASLALIAVPPAQKLEYELCFHSDDVDADVRALRARGVTFMGEARTLEFGRVAHARDPEGNLLSLLKPIADSAPGRDVAMTAAVLNCRDVGAARTWYRDHLGLSVLVDSPWWVEMDTGETRVALHPWVDQGVLETHHACPITVGFASGDLDEWVEELRLRGVDFASDITDRGFGRFAEARDPDGNVVVLRDSPAPPTLEEKLAEEYESGDEPHHVAIRKAVNKNSKAVSRLAVRPEYHSGKRSESRAVAAAEAALETAGVKKQDGPAPAPAKVVATPQEKRAAMRSVRGGGPDRTRLKPRKTGDPERVRTKPAVGHQQKATVRSLDSQKRGAATTSRGKPVKHEAVRSTKRTRAGRAGRAGKG
ncbi:MAG TPA: VOC family protein [Candidatus Udaeobacter sp.]|jgi:catechol 2,3-dioxygenase-like lactoylglutathione lyase family enzyme|nr:VOC family protein [Candidatus Udaeobacter sp.]